MTARTFLCVLLLSSCHLVTLSPCHARADGGSLRLREQANGYQIAVFTSPTPYRAGPVDISVLVQDAVTGECLPDARVVVRLTACGSEEFLEYPATTETAINKLFRAAEFQLPEPGRWDVVVTVEGPHGPALVRFEIQADEPLPRWLDLWPWFAWPALLVALFGVHRILAEKGAEATAGVMASRSSFSTRKNLARQTAPP
jgi:hypothetical protein